MCKMSHLLRISVGTKVTAENITLKQRVYVIMLLIKYICLAERERERKRVLYKYKHDLGGEHINKTLVIQPARRYGMYLYRGFLTCYYYMPTTRMFEKEKFLNRFLL